MDWMKMTDCDDNLVAVVAAAVVGGDVAAAGIDIVGAAGAAIAHAVEVAVGAVQWQM